MDEKPPETPGKPPEKKFDPIKARIKRTSINVTPHDKAVLDRVLSGKETKNILDEVCLHFISCFRGPRKFARVLYELTQHVDCPMSTRVRIMEFILNKRMQIEERAGVSEMATMTSTDLETEARSIMHQLRRYNPKHMQKYTTDELRDELGRRDAKAQEEAPPAPGEPNGHV